MERIRKDEFFPLSIEGMEGGYMLSAKYDRVDFFPWLGHHILKIYDDEEGLIGMHISAPTAKAIIDCTGIPLVRRNFIYESEHEGYLVALDKMMDNWL